MPRLFTASRFPKRSALHLSLIRAPLAGAKWIEPENMHITLRFVGDIDGRTADEFADCLAEVHARPFQVDHRRASAPSAAASRACCGPASRPASRSTLSTARNDRAARAAGLEPDRGRSGRT